MGKIGLIIKREYTTRVKKKSFIIMTILGPLLVVGFLFAAVYLGQQEEKDLEILVHDDTFVLYEEMDKSSDRFHLTLTDDEGIETYEQAQAFFKENEKYDLLIYLPETIIKTNSSVGKILFKEAPSGNVQRFLERGVNNAIESYKLKDLNISQETYIKLKHQVQLHTIDIETMEEKNVGLRAGVGFVFGLMIYLFIFMYGIQVMKGVIEEKSNRIVEVIVSSVKPFQLMMGKIIGIMFVGLTQFLIWVFLSIGLMTVLSATVLPDLNSPMNQANGPEITEQVAVGVPGDIETNQDMQEAGQELIDMFFNQIPWTLMLSLFVFYFIGGYLLYGSLMAAIGAAVDSETDTQQFMLPITAPLIFAYIIAVMAIENPNSPAVIWCSEIPFTSPIVMLVRVAMGAEGLGWAIALSMALLIGTFIGTTYLAGRIYRTGILMYGKKVTYRELFKWMRYK